MLQFTHKTLANYTNINIIKEPVKANCSYQLALARSIKFTYCNKVWKILHLIYFNLHCVNLYRSFIGLKTSIVKHGVFLQVMK